MTRVKVIFHPRENPTPIDMDLTPTISAASFPGFIKTCNHQGFELYCFDKSIDVVDRLLLAAPMAIPKFFEETNNSDCSGMYLLRTPALPAAATIAKFNDFILDILSVGPHGCPQRVFMGKGVGADGFSNDYFTFHNQRYYPFITKEFYVGYYVCDFRSQSAWRPEQPGEIGISVDEKISYDAGLGILSTRQAHVV